MCGIFYLPLRWENLNDVIKLERGVNMKYVCQVCGYVYDEEVEGVNWEDLGDDYECPLCGVGKDDFEPED